MNRLIFPAIAATLLLPCAGPAATILSLQAPAAVSAGSVFQLDVRIEGVSDLASYQFDIGYNPLLLSGVSVLEGPFQLTAGPTLFIPGTIDDISGLVSFTAGAIAGVGPGASGDGVIASLFFRALSAGVADLVLTSSLLYSSVPDPISATVSGTSVRIEQSAVPEPATVWTVLCAVAYLLASRRRRRE